MIVVEIKGGKYSLSQVRNRSVQTGAPLATEIYWLRYLVTSDFIVQLLHLCKLTLFDMGLFEPSVMGGGGGMRDPHHNFVVIALMIMEFGTGVKLDVFHIMVTKM